MSWEYNDSGAFMTNSSGELDFASSDDVNFIRSLGATTPLYANANYYSSYDPLITRFRTRGNKPADSFLLFDDFDDLALEVETSRDFLATNYVPNKQVGHYIPSLFYDIEPQLSTDKNKATLVSNRNVEPPPPPPAFFYPLSPNFQTVPFNVPLNAFQQQQQQQQQLFQYQQLMAQQQSRRNPLNNKNLTAGLNDIELLKIKQQQDKHKNQLGAAAGTRTFGKENANIGNNLLTRQLKQNSETSIPSTNADPLGSNLQTPSVLSTSNNKNEQPAVSLFNPKNNFLMKAPSPSQPSQRDNVKKQLQTSRHVKEKYTPSDYKSYQENYGFGKDFLPFEFETKSEKLEKARKREEYSKMIRERNTFWNETFQNRKFQQQFIKQSNAIIKSRDKEPFNRINIK